MKTRMIAAVSAPEQVRGEGFIDTATLELLAEWRRVDATNDPARILAAELEIAVFKKALNESRSTAGQPLLFP